MAGNYRASNSLAYYDVGEVYSFYIKNNSNYIPIQEDEVKQFVPKFEQLENTGVLTYHPKFCSMTRVFGVVIEKIQKKRDQDNDKIRVLMRIIDEDGVISYGIKTFVVGYHSVETDGADMIPVCSYISGLNPVAEHKTNVGGTTGPTIISGGTTGPTRDLGGSNKTSGSTGPTIDRNCDSKSNGVDGKKGHSTGITIDTNEKRTGVTIA